MMRAIEVGCLKLHNSLAENESRPIALGRKNISSAATTNRWRTCAKSSRCLKRAKRLEGGSHLSAKPRGGQPAGGVLNALLLSCQIPSYGGKAAAGIFD